MQPSFDLRIRTMMKALSETVLPAVDADNKAAIEQAHIVIGSLELLRQQVDHAHWFEVCEARDMAALVRAILHDTDLSSAREAEAVAANALGIAGRGDIPLSRLREANRVLRQAIAGLIEDAFAAADGEVGRHVQSLVLAQGERQIGRERAFVAATGFEVFPDTLPTLADALAEPGGGER